MKVSDIPSIVEEGILEKRQSINEVLIDNFGFTVMGYRRYKKGRLTLQQHPKELSGLLESVTKIPVKNYLEIGLGSCVTVFVVDSYFRVMNKRYETTLGIDIKDVSENFVEYTSRQSNCAFSKINVMEYSLDRQYDLIMIDTNQRYGDMKNVFEKCKPNARFIAFHDINSNRYGAKRLFGELSKEYESQSWIHSGAGIGLLRIAQ